MAGPGDPNGGIGKPPPSRGGDTLEYLCELIIELRQIADNSGQPTLSAILAAALTEARIQKNQTRR